MRNILVGAGVAALLAGAAVAQDMPPPGGPPPMPMGSLKRADVPGLVAQRFAMMDVNHDGVLTDADKDAMRDKRRAEMVAHLKEHRDRAFAAMDANRDGAISRQEFDNPPPPPGGPGVDGAPPPPPPGGAGPGPMRGPGAGFGMMAGHLLGDADANGDGKITLAEAQKAALAGFDKADVNHDGILDRDEMMVAMHERMGGMGGHGRGPGHDDMRPPRKEP